MSLTTNDVFTVGVFLSLVGAVILFSVALNQVRVELEESNYIYLVNENGEQLIDPQTGYPQRIDKDALLIELVNRVNQLEQRLGTFPRAIPVDSNAIGVTT